MKYAIKTQLLDHQARTFVFNQQRSMYSGKNIQAGDEIFIFDSENEGGQGLFARGVVTYAEMVAKQPGIARQNQHVSITVERTAFARQRLGRVELKPFVNWEDGSAESELNFKFYRQATNKVVGLSDTASTFLEGYF